MSNKKSEKKTTKTTKVTNKVAKNSVPTDYKKLQEEALKILPMIQTDIWKTLNINSKQCSRLLDKMEKANLIKRTKLKCKTGGVTFMVERIEVIEVEPKTNFSALLAGGILSPCCGCQLLECHPVSCVLMDKWVKSMV